MTALAVRFFALTLLLTLVRGAPGQNTGPATQPTSDDVETVVFLRHGEKPQQGQGQITPQGLNRALALAKLLPEKFGKPDFLFAPDPGQTVKDPGGVVNYVRPLATIEPTAIRYEMPVGTPYGYRDMSKLDDDLEKPEFAGKVIFVAWEHAYAERGAIEILKHFNADTSKVPHWHGSDFDSLYVVKISRPTGRPGTAVFELDHEGLDGLSKEMPAPAGK